MLKRIGLLASVGSCAALLFWTTPTPATAIDGSAVGRYCRLNAPPELTFGECVKQVASFGPQAVCQNFGALGFRNHGECVSTIQREIRELLKTVP